MNTHGKIFIYGLFLGDDCIYVGQTRNLTKRMNQHSHRAFRGIGFVPRVIHTCRTLIGAVRHERACISRMRKAGHPIRNNSKPEIVNYIPRDTRVFICDKTGELFFGFASIGRHVGSSARLVKLYYQTKPNGSDSFEIWGREFTELKASPYNPYPQVRAGRLNGKLNHPAPHHKGGE